MDLVVVVRKGFVPGGFVLLISCRSRCRRLCCAFCKLKQFEWITLDALPWTEPLKVYTENLSIRNNVCPSFVVRPANSPLSRRITSSIAQYAPSIRNDWKLNGQLCWTHSISHTANTQPKTEKHLYTKTNTKNIYVIFNTTTTMKTYIRRIDRLRQYFVLLG